ncbi:MAG: hypothetical protein FWD28_10070 [Treponema sp.]|nr:hypothetical protein [Treponema sp.]
MKKLIFLSILVIFSVSSFAFELPNRSIFIEGSASVSAHRTFFMTNFRMEASAMGFTVASTRAEAGYTFRFDVQPYSDEYDPSIRFIVLITLTYNETDQEMVSFGWPFAEIDDMYEYNQFVFYRAAVLIPGISESDIENLLASGGGGRARRGAADQGEWKFNWLYVRASLDYPISFYLNPDSAIWGPAPPAETVKVHNRILPAPGLTIGLEVMFLDFLSLEVNAQVIMGNLVSSVNLSDFNLSVGAELKYIFRLNNIMFQPYGTFIYHLMSSTAFAESDGFPSFSFGGGIQIGVRGPGSGIFFLNVNYLTSFDGVKIKNDYGPTHPNPDFIGFDRFVVGLGFGFKYGFLSRN